MLRKMDSFDVELEVMDDDEYEAEFADEDIGDKNDNDAIDNTPSKKK